MNNHARVDQATSLTDSIKLVIHPLDDETGYHLQKLGFRPIPPVPQLVYRSISHEQISEMFLHMSQMLSDYSQSGSRYCITRSPLDSKTLLIEFLDAQPLSSITTSAKHAWFLQTLAQQNLFFKYQPIFDLRQGYVIGYECLARARDDRGRHFSGQQLIDAAISMHLTREFDELARTTCLQAIAATQSQQIFFIRELQRMIDPAILEHREQEAPHESNHPHPTNR